MKTVKQPKVIFLREKTVISIITKAIATEFQRIELEKKKSEGEKVYSINAVSRKLGKNFHTIKKYCQAGLIRTVPGGGIPESAILEFLNNSNTDH